MEAKVIYSFEVYLRRPTNNLILGDGTFTSTVRFDTIITLMGSNLDDALLKMPEEYRDYDVIRVDYPIGYPNFPLFPPSTSTAGYEYNLRKV